MLPTTRFFHRRTAALTLAAALAAMAGTTPAAAGRAGGCETETQAGALACHDLGEFSASVLRASVSVSPSGKISSLRTLSTVVRLRSTSDKPIALAYRVGSLRVVDDAGNAYLYQNTDPRRVTGIGLIAGAKADPQLVLAPGQTREVRFDAQKAYHTADGLDGNVYSQDLVLVELRPGAGNRVEVVRDYAVSLSGIKPPALLNKDAARALTDPFRQMLKKMH